MGKLTAGLMSETMKNKQTAKQKQSATTESHGCYIGKEHTCYGGVKLL